MGFKRKALLAFVAALAGTPACPAAQVGEREGQVRTGSLPGMRVRGIPRLRDLDGLPRSHLRIGPTEPSLLLDTQTTLDALQRRREQTQHPLAGYGAIDGLTNQAASFAADCNRGLRQACGTRDALYGAVARLTAGTRAAPSCDPAARALADSYASGATPDADARRFDVACLGSIETRTGPGLADPAPKPPLIAAAMANPASGALAAVGIIQQGSIPFCAGLLRSDGTLVTAAHCVDGRLADLRMGAFTVRPASGTGGPWKLVGVAASHDATDGAAANDWIVLKVEPGARITAPTVLIAKPEPGPVTMVGHYAFYGQVGYATSGLETWRKGLRYPLPGLCEAVRVESDCVQLACQTIRGFSGTPVFRASPAPDGSPVLVGIVSGEATDSGDCPAAFAGATAVVWAGGIR